MLSQEQFAHRVGLTQSGLSRIETGRRNLDWATLVRLLAFFDLQPVLATESVDASLDVVLDREAMRGQWDWFDDLPDGRLLLRMLDELPLTADGSFGARMHGLPVTVGEVDLLVDPVHKALPTVNTWLGGWFAQVSAGADERTFWTQLGALMVNLHLLDHPAPRVHIEAPPHLDELVLPAGATIAVSPVHLLRLGSDDRRIADLAARRGQP